MPDFTAKFDPSLLSIHSVYLLNGDTAFRPGGALHNRLAPNKRVNVKVIYEGDLDAIKAAGFEASVLRKPTEADGYISLDKLQAVASLPSVISISNGARVRLHDVSVADINARGPSATAVWDVNSSSGAFTGQTGAGVIVAVIDTGIDFRHNHFMSVLTPQRQTRIRRIWDMGLIKQTGEKQPSAASLGLAAGSSTYGVVYDDADINAALNSPNPPLPVRHRDCVGHGTHVASTAAGRGHGTYSHVGVAPDTELIVVKILLLQNEPPGTFESWFADAINYILNTARTELGDKPVVINCSFGSNTGAHDGFGALESVVNTVFGPASASKALVFASGNDGDDLQHFTANVTSADSSVKLQLFDDRAASEFKYYWYCKHLSTTHVLNIALWYPVIAGNTVSATISVPNIVAPFAFPALGATRPVDAIGPAGRQSMNLTHEAITNNGVTRNRLNVVLTHHRDKHVEGDYVITLHSTVPTKVEIWCERGAFSFGLKFKSIDSSNNQKLIDSGGAEHAITVAAYTTRTLDGMAAGDLVYFSSRGPMVSYTATPPIVKPDIAAPGYAIEAAASVHATGANPRAIIPSISARSNRVSMNGTSMAAPHVTGVVALMLQKNPALTTAQIKAKLKSHFRARPVGGTDAEWGAGKLDAKGAHDNA